MKFTEHGTITVTARLVGDGDVVAGGRSPADESILFALRTSDGVRGTWAIAYGLGADPLDAEIARRLRRAG